MKIFSALVVTAAFVRYFYLSCRKGSRESLLPFYSALLDAIELEKFPHWSRPFTIVFVLTSALNAHDDKTALRALRTASSEMPWQQVSAELLRRIFECCIVQGEEDLAKHTLFELNTRTGSCVLSRQVAEYLVRWRFGTLAPKDAAQLDTTTRYFVSYPSVDEYFKGAICEMTGRIADAKEHLGRALDLIPIEQMAIRTDILRRLDRLARNFDSYVSTVKVR